jgi:phage terminase large subunit-like protein
VKLTKRTETIAQWKSDTMAFITGALRDSETGQPFALYAEQERFLRKALQRTPEGRMRQTELCHSAPEKSGKTTLAAMVVIYTAVELAAVNGEIYILANDLEQRTSRVFKAVVQILEAFPLLRDSVHITANRITFRSRGVTIQALSNDYRVSAARIRR